MATKMSMVSMLVMEATEHMTNLYLTGTSPLWPTRWLTISYVLVLLLQEV